MNKPLVSVITLNWNCSSQTIDIVKAFQKQTYKNIEVIIVDNDSANDDYDNLKSKLKKIRDVCIIRSERNLGYTGGMNLGSKHAKGKYLLIVVADVLPSYKTMIEDFVNLLEREHAIALSPLVLASDNTIRYGGAHITWYGHALRNFSGIKLGKTKLSKVKHPIETEIFGGACFMIRRKDFLKTKFDSSYLAWWEDVELSLRLRNKIKNCKFLFVPFHSVIENGISPVVKVKSLEWQEKISTRNKYRTLSKYAIHKIPFSILYDFARMSKALFQKRFYVIAGILNGMLMRLKEIII